MFAAKKDTNVEGKSKNESGIQDESQKCQNCIDSLFIIRKHHSNKIVMAHIDINSLRNKFDMLTNTVTEYIHILMIFETKLSDTFLHALCHLKDFSNLWNLGLLKDNIPSNLVNLGQKVENFEDFFIEFKIVLEKQMVLVIRMLHTGNTK